MNLDGLIKDAFGIDILNYPKVISKANECFRAYSGNPDWIDADDNITTAGFANTICQEVARLAMLGTSVKIEGSARAKFLQGIIDKNYSNLRKWVELSYAFGTVIVKPNGADFDCYTPDEFRITETLNDEIWGAVFVDSRKADTDKWYTRLEYHRFEDGQYIVSNRCYVGKSKYDSQEAVPIEETMWRGIMEEAVMDNVTRPIFSVIKSPNANNIEVDSPLGLPIICGAMQELHDLDIAYSRFTLEIDESKKLVMIDSDRLIKDGGSKKDKESTVYKLDYARANMGLPAYVRAVEGTGEGNIYNEVNPTLQTEPRIAGINYLLSQISYKIGFSNGYFVFNETQGIQTATGVEASQQRTIQFVKDYRDVIEMAVKNLIESLAKVADVLNLSPAGEYEVNLDFGDITYNREEDRARYYSYVSSGLFPFWRFLVKFEGFTEDDAKAIEQEMKAQAQERAMGGIGTLFAQAQNDMQE